MSHRFRAFDIQGLVFVKQPFDGGKEVISQILNLVLHARPPEWCA
ncbi:hypothetical protein CSC43_3085 [Pseudomonas aeruginosa]|nr:hypothetical protein CSB88_2455 [Pseudomonas aeruginosa]RCH34467.1 hypothetical protein CSC43_3085 [Pseudomonas aeruginosa]